MYKLISIPKEMNAIVNEGEISQYLDYDIYTHISFV